MTLFAVLPLVIYKALHITYRASFVYLSILTQKKKVCTWLEGFFLYLQKQIIGKFGIKMCKNVSKCAKMYWLHDVLLDNYQIIVLRVKNVGVKIKSCIFVMFCNCFDNFFDNNKKLRDNKSVVALIRRLGDHNRYLLIVT